MRVALKVSSLWHLSALLFPRSSNDNYKVDLTWCCWIIWISWRIVWNNIIPVRLLICYLHNINASCSSIFIKRENFFDFCLLKLEFKIIISFVLDVSVIKVRALITLIVRINQISIFSQCISIGNLFFDDDEG